MSEERLCRHVHAPAGGIGERHVWRPMALHAAADYIRSELGILGFAIASQAYPPFPKWSYPGRAHP